MSAVITPTFLRSEGVDRPLIETDRDVAEILAWELRRQQTTLEMVASANSAPRAILEAYGSVVVNKLTEGYPGKRYWGGTECIDVLEQLAIDRVTRLFGAEHANVQPHSGAQANAAAYMALLEPGDTFLGMHLAHGGHLTHGMRLNFSGRLYRAVPYQVRASDGRVDMEQVARLAEEHQPKLIVAGWSAYPRHLDFAAFRRIADNVGAALLVDMAHFAGLVAAGLYPNPVPFADVVTSTTHKTLGGPRGGLILCRSAYGRAIDTAVFPGQQSAPLQNAIAAKAVAFKIADGPEFRDRIRRTLDGARAIAERLQQSDVTAAGVRVVSGGTDVHLVLLDLRDARLTGLEAEDRLYDLGITVNRNVVPSDPLPPTVTSGLRIGASALATRGFGLDDFVETADVIASALCAPELGHARRDALRCRIAALAARHPLYEPAPTGE